MPFVGIVSFQLRRFSVSPPNQPPAPRIRETSASSVGGPRIFAAYVVAEPGPRGRLLPAPSGGAYSRPPSPFRPRNGPVLRHNLSYRLVSKSTFPLAPGLHDRGSCSGGAAEDGGCRTFSFSFPVGLGGSEGSYCSRRRTRWTGDPMSELAKGVVRLEPPLRRVSRVFKARSASPVSRSPGSR
jgi:hypothetical protein